MAGIVKRFMQRFGEKILRTLKLLVLSFWIGGGLATGGLVYFFSWASYSDQADNIRSIKKDILSWFSLAEIIVGGALCLLLFFVDFFHSSSLP